MASSSQTHARIRLNFVNSPLDSVWMLIDYKKLPLISDIVYEVNKRYFGGHTDLSLSLHGSRLPLEEGSLLLRDEDAVTVRVERHDNDSGSSTTTTAVINTTATEAKKRKRKHEESDSEEILTKEQSSGHSSAKEEEKHAKKKRKKEQKRREKERLKEIADIVSSYTDVSRSSSSKHESSKDASTSSKKASREDSHLKEKLKDDSTRVYAGTSKDKDSESERKIENVANDSDKESHGHKHKKKRIRKHRKHKSKRSISGELRDPNSSLIQRLQNIADSQIVESQASENASNKTSLDPNVLRYTGNPVSPGQPFYGALPDKLLQPKYYRHQYHNLRKYVAEPNTHTKFNSDSENEEKQETHNLEQYNFLCSTRYSEFPEAGVQQPDTPQLPPNMFTSPGVPNNNSTTPDAPNNNFTSPGAPYNNFNANFNDSIPDFQSASTPNTSENTKDKAENQVANNNFALDPEKVNGDLGHGTGHENLFRIDRFGNTNANNSHSKSHSSFNGYSGYAEGTANPGQGATPTSLVQSALPNGVTVFTRQRRGTPNANTTPTLTKEQQLNDVATNRSFIVQNPIEPETSHSQVAEFKVDPGETLQAEKYNSNNSALPPPPVKKDYSTFPALAGPPRIGDKIAYKILEMSPDYTPEVSGYKEAEVLNYDQATQNVHLKNLFKDVNKNPYGNKFDISMEYGDTLLTNVEEELDEAMFHWTSLLEPRLVS